MQEPDHQSEGDARLAALGGPVFRSVVRLGAIATLAFVLALVLTSFKLTLDGEPRALEVDFRVFWAAGRLVWQGTPLSALDFHTLAAVHDVAPEQWMPWLYPPAALLAVAPLGAVPYAYAYLAWVLLSVGAIALAMRPFAGATPRLWMALTLAPAYVPALVIGQTSVLWLAGLMFAFAALRDGRYVLSGICIGLLTLKPQFGLLIPVALLAAGLWRTIIAASATTAVLVLIPSLTLGWEYWPRLLDLLRTQADRLMEHIPTLARMVGPFFTLTSLGVPPQTALNVQWAILAASVVVVFLIWRCKSIGFDAKAAALLAAMMISSPYLWYYETAMCVGLALFMVRAGLLGESWPQRALLVLLWMGGVLIVVNAFYKDLNPQLIGGFSMTPILGACMVIIVLHYLAVRRAPPAPSV